MPVALEERSTQLKNKSANKMALMIAYYGSLSI